MSFHTVVADEQKLYAAFGTVSHPTIPQLQRSLFFGIASKLIFSPIIPS